MRAYSLGLCERVVADRAAGLSTAEMARQVPALKPVADWTVSAAGIAYLKGYETFVAYPYDDADAKTRKTRVPKWPADDPDAQQRITIGYGHKIENEREWNTRWAAYHDGVTELTVAAGESVFREDVAAHSALVQDSIGVPVSQAEFDALSILAFNLGDPQFPNSSVVKFLDGDATTAPDYATLEAAWKWWRKSNKQVSQGLIHRRRDEWTLFTRGVYARTFD